MTNHGVGGYQKPRQGQTNEWLTPPDILRALGPFDLDPCSPIDRPWDTAAAHYTTSEDGLSQPWRGRVWLNPPYGPKTTQWLKALSEHGTGTALVFARTETRMFHKWVWPRASAVMFMSGRLHFHHLNGERAKGNAGGPSVLIAYGAQDALNLKYSLLPGHFIPLQPSPALSKTG